MPSAFRRKGSAKKASAATRNNDNVLSNDEASAVRRGGATPKPISMMAGVKPWTGGIHLTSTGLRDLDAIAGGGQPLGTCTYLQQDRWTHDLAHCLVRYWCAEALSHGQHLIAPIFEEASPSSNSSLITSTGDSEDDDENIPQSLWNDAASKHSQMELILQSLPRNLHWDKWDQRSKKQDQQQQQSQSVASVGTNLSSLQILEEDEEGGDDFNNDIDENESKTDEGLSIAWQYKASVQKQRTGGITPSPSSPSSGGGSKSDVFCFSYDLSGRLQEQLQSAGRSNIAPTDTIKKCLIDATLDPAQKTMSAFRSLLVLLHQHQQHHGDRILRILFFQPNLDILSHVLPLLLSHIRTKSLPVVVMVCTPPATTNGQMKATQTLQRTSDLVLSTEGFASRKEYPPPPEFRHLQGLLSIHKASTVTAATALESGHFADLTMSKRPASNLYGLKRDRRKLNIPLLHIPPEDYAAGGSSVGSGVRSGGGKPDTKKTSSGGGMGCSSNLEGSALDF